MQKLQYYFLVTTLLLVSSLSFGQNRAKGYYKDIFFDGGIFLNSYPDLPAANYLNLSIEMFNSSKSEYLTALDTLYQTLLFCGSEIDENGILLYPDGAPRFRMIYTNGGKATQHGRSLGEKGRENVRRFVAEGGSYLGTCAGAYIASKGFVRDSGIVDVPEYYGIWPGYTRGTTLNKSFTSLFVEKGSPLIQYYSFGGDMVIDSVRHNGGCFAWMENNVPEGTEVTLRYDGDTLKIERNIHREVAGWAYKASEYDGRVVLIGSHPERVVSGERLELMSAMIKYALDGNGRPRLKGILENGEPREMKCSTSENNPAFTKIGDRQYHHFAVNIPKGTDKVTITISPQKGWEEFDLYLFANPESFAFNDNSLYFNVGNGVAKDLTIIKPAAGRVYISVFCATTVDTEATSYGQQYTGRIGVLNGVPYTISVSY
ncbi:MAG TPA: BPL-N domain-containing protein [Bacteroidales bacterium]|jgi:glutamine amidotransferase-like uncharacterized protein|nr:hypothetical protein [Bacteroidales bacterium]HKM12155.1 BPL-N domain-containing protein [Bacteroidales bacterium]HPB89112.1 BPL-N domain-containing protein [Bacteroidales bacterium]HPY22053.1 BPL-N domain-containing protein [Bacteroidales bacterium]HQA93098.1 BPL-N domain-containing protein [Bacteroidales bacterium]